jgi:hypothetical protein
MKYVILSVLIWEIATIKSPAHAQFSSFSGSDSCSGICVKLDFGSANNDSSYNSSFNSGFNNNSTTVNNNLRWQLGVTWKPNPTETAQADKQRLEDNRTLMTTLADAIAQNKTELAHGLAILLAPRLGYTNPAVLLAELKQGSLNSGVTPKEIPKKDSTVIPSTTPSQEGATTGNQSPINNVTPTDNKTIPSAIQNP